MADPAFEGLLNHYQSLGVAPSTRRTYQAGVRALQQFCNRYTVTAFPASPLTLCYFCCYMACQVSYKTIKVYHAGIRLGHIERGFEDPMKDELLHLLCTGIKQSQGVSLYTHLPIIITVLQTLKSQLSLDPSFSPLEKCLLWAAFTLAFYGFLRASEFATPNLTWRHIQLAGDRYTVLIEQSKTDPFRHGHTIAIHASGTSTCPVRALQLYVSAILPLQDDSPVFKGDRFSPLDRQHLTNTIRHLLLKTKYIHHQCSSYSFRSGAATTAAGAGIPDWLIKILGRWSSNAYQVYIHSSPAMIQSVPALLAHANISNTGKAAMAQ